MIFLPLLKIARIHGKRYHTKCESTHTKFLVEMSRESMYLLIFLSHSTTWTTVLPVGPEKSSHNPIKEKVIQGTLKTLFSLVNDTHGCVQGFLVMSPQTDKSKKKAQFDTAPAESENNGSNNYAEWHCHCRAFYGKLKTRHWSGKSWAGG